MWMIVDKLLTKANDSTEGSSATIDRIIRRINNFRWAGCAPRIRRFCRCTRVQSLTTTGSRWLSSPEELPEAGPETSSATARTARSVEIPGSPVEDRLTSTASPEAVTYRRKRLMARGSSTYVSSKLPTAAVTCVKLTRTQWCPLSAASIFSVRIEAPSAPLPY